MKSQIMPTLVVRLRSHWARRRSLILGSGLLVLAALLSLQLFGRYGAGARAAFALIMVTTTADNTTADGFCSLREAILSANGAPANGDCTAGITGPDVINFALGAGTPTINVSGSPLPTITETVTIDGATGGATRVELNGAGAGASANGLFINNTDNCMIKSLVINRFNGTPGVNPASGNGIRIVDSDNTVVENCYIGTNPAGNAALANSSNGVYGYATNDSDIKNNLLSGNGQSGVYFHQDGAGCQRNNIRGNIIGTNLAGTAAIPNAENGIHQQSCTHSIIGGTTAADRNLVSGNIGNGMAISSFHQVLGNYVGVDVTGTVALGNGNGIGAGHNNIIGGTTPGARNIISASISDGISFLSQGNGANSQVIGNYIGTDVTGTVNLGNNRYGVYIRESGDIIVGGTTSAERNIISGNTTVGVFLHAANDCQVLGNYIGPNVNGTVAFSSEYGVQVDAGTGGGMNHLISGNVIGGHSIFGVLLSNPINNRLFGNIIGASPTLAPMPNHIGVATGGNSPLTNQIGGTGPGEGNIIAFNTYGVSVGSGVSHKISGNSIYSNSTLGIDLSPDGVTPNDLGDGDTGANNLQNFPIITQANATGIQGTLNSTANAAFTLQFFYNLTCDTLGNGEGKNYVGQTTVNTNGSGNATFNYPSTLPLGVVATATATDAAGNTSEFSSCRTVSGAAVPPVCCGDWTQVSSTGPAPRDISAAVYASACNRVVLFGGRKTGGIPPANVTDETWEWDGNTKTWTQFTPAVKPPARGEHKMAYDSVRNKVVLFSGFNNNFGSLNDTWEYDCGTHTWTELNPANTPPGRSGFAMAYDPLNNVTVVHGGSGGRQDTWTWNGTNWMQLASATQPGARADHALAFDGKRLMLHGGITTSATVLNDTWGFTGTGWTLLSVLGPTRYRHGMAYNPACGSVTLFSGNATNNTYEWDGQEWCLVTATTSPSTREYPATAYDGQGVLVFGGQATNLSQLGDTWRYFCNQPSTWRLGYADNFSFPTPAEPPTAPSAAFLANINGVYSTPPKKGFDDPATDKFFLHSFTSLPANIVRAELEVRMRPEAGGTSNDSIHFDFPPFNAPSFTWGQNIFALHPGGTWNPGQGAYTFVLDLGNLPAGGSGQPTDLLSRLNTHRSLHLMIQDDTTVDYLQLRLWTCPAPTYFAGLRVAAEGQAQLGMGVSGNLAVSNIGASGNDGVNFNLGEAAGAGFTVATPVSSFPNNSQIEIQSIGTLGGVPDNVVSTLRAIMGNVTVVTPSFNALGATTYHAAFYNTYTSGATSIASVGGLSEGAVSFPKGNFTMSFRQNRKNQMEFILSAPVAFSVGGQVVGTADGVVFTAENPTEQVDFFTQMRAIMGNVTVVDFSPLTITALPFFPPTSNVFPPSCLVQGNAHLEPFSGGLAVTNLGASGQDGVSFSNQRAVLGNVTVAFDGIDPMSIAPVGAKLQVSSSHILSVLPPPPPRKDFVTLSRAGAVLNSPISIAANFSELGATASRVVAFSGNTQVADVNNFGGMVTSSAWPTGFRHNGPTMLGYEFTFPAGTSISFNPCPPAPCDPLGNITSLRILPQNPNVTVSYLTATNVFGANLPEFTVANVTGTPFCQGTLSFTPATLQPGLVSQPYAEQLRVSGGLPPHSFTATGIPAGLTLTSFGRVSGTPTQGGSFNVEVTATDANGCTGTKSYTLIVDVCSPITVNPATLPNPTVGQAYNQMLTATGGTGPSTFRVVLGNIKLGLTLSLNGLISGTPTQAGTSSFTIEATDANGCIGTRVYTVTVNCPTVTVNPLTLPNGIVGAAYNQTFTQTGGSGTPTWSLSAGSAPPGLTLSPTTGLLSGTPTGFGSFNFTVQVTDGNGCTGTRNYTLTITCPSGLITVNPASIPNGFVGTAYNQTFTATGGTGPYSFTRVNGTLPPGLALATSGAITGTPTTAGTFNFTVQATDANGCQGERGYTVVIGGSGLQFYPLPTTVRALETRPGFNGCTAPGAPILANTSLTLAMRTGCTGIPADATAVTGNITVVPQYSAGGYLTLFPSNAAQPVVANSNFKPNEVTNNVFTVGLGPADGAFKIFASATTDVIVDVTGYFAPPSPTGLYFHPLNEPVRLVETRTLPGLTGCIKPGAPFPAGATLVQGRSPVAAPCNVIPDTAQVLVGNATTIFPSAGGFLTIYSSDAIRPLAANSNFAGGDVINGPFAVKLGADGKFNVFTPAATELVIDILGYYSADAVDANGAGLLFTILPKPIRELETRPDFPGFALTGCFRPNAPIQGGAGGIRTQQIWGTCDGINIPNVARAILGNVTVVNPAPNPIASGFLTHYPGNVVTPPTVATSNYPIPVIFGYNRFFVVGLSPADGTFKMFTSTTTDVILDVSGYFAP